MFDYQQFALISWLVVMVFLGLMSCVMWWRAPRDKRMEKHLFIRNIAIWLIITLAVAVFTIPKNSSNPALRAIRLFVSGFFN